MAVIHIEKPKGRDYTAEELIGRRIRIEGPVPKKKSPPPGYAMWVIADDDYVDNVLKVELVIEPCAVVEAKLTLYHGVSRDGAAITEVVTARDNVEVSFSAIVSEVQ